MCKIANVTLFLLLIICAVTDWKEKRIPVSLLVLATLASGAFSLLCENVVLSSRLLGAGVGIIMFLISKITKEAIGYGDDWLILMLGIYLGWGKLLQLILRSLLCLPVRVPGRVWRSWWHRCLGCWF